MYLEPGKEYNSKARVKIGPVWLNMTMRMVVDTETKFHGFCSGAFSNYSFDNGIIENNGTNPKLTYTATVMGREQTSVVVTKDDGTFEGEAISKGMKPMRIEGTLVD